MKNYLFLILTSLLWNKCILCSLTPKDDEKITGIAAGAGLIGLAATGIVKKRKKSSQQKYEEAVDKTKKEQFNPDDQLNSVLDSKSKLKQLKNNFKATIKEDINEKKLKKAIKLFKKDNPLAKVSDFTNAAIETYRQQKQESSSY